MATSTIKVKNIQVKESAANKFNHADVKHLIEKVNSDNSMSGLFKNICYKLRKNTLILF